MLSVLANRTYRHLFAAQVIALVGTGLMTVALGLLAFKIAGDKAGAVLGTALAIKMIAYVGIAPIAGSLAGYVPRRPFLITMDLLRAFVAVALPFVTQVWQVYVLIFFLQAASASFTPTFQATIPDVLSDERDYTNALSLSRLAYDLENLLSPTLAAAILTIISFNILFAGTVVGFLCSAALVVSVRLPSPTAGTDGDQSFYAKTTKGMRIYLATPRLRGLLALNLSVAAAGAMVIVNTVVLVRATLGRADNDVALALACFGGGSMLAALLLPHVLDRLPDRAVMISAAGLLTILLLILASVLFEVDHARIWPILLVLWALMGMGYSAVQTPTGRLLRRSAQPADRPAVFAAQFALSHGCWLLTYPVSGWLGGSAGLSVTAFVLAAITLAGAVAAAMIWPADDPETIEHEHPALAQDDPHLEGALSKRHAHIFVIDDHHRRWPNDA
ncbi:MFS transporter [Bradyrhizobium elkanii]|uniref:MFS transporter n=1 Tax=Bradyrhizobium elkanii TaxID=29448 RepID=UPI000841871D|nr:MFS transporter [Bradyrhizobium elkanii]ODM72071.1 MFS transporter [Bradyrhizobium elkanii]ODM84970.1 MFS transporter [Bradyrhizobium elkanii]